MEPVLAFLGFIFVALLVRWTSQRRTPTVSCLPPGPRPIPFLGNVHQLPLVNQQKTFAEWGAAYGDIVYLRLFRTPAIVINSAKVAHDLLEKRSAKYSHRPRFVLLQDLMGWDVLTHFSYGERFRKHRRWITNAFQDKQALLSYRPLQRREVYTLLTGLLETPEQFMPHIRRFAAALIMDIAYGHRVMSSNDEYIHIADRAGKETVESGNAGSMLVDFFPSLRYVPTWFPGGGFKRKAAEVKKLVQTMLDTPFDMVRKALASGTASPCFMVSLLEETLRQGSLSREDEDDIKSAAGVLYGAATDTTVVILSTFILAMLLHPEVYEKAQAEMDSVIGSDRLPDFDDREVLPYLECVIREVFRWNCPVPLGIPHRTTQPDEYQGFVIPAGSTVIANIWAMTQDEALYPQPRLFRPERFMEMEQPALRLLDPRNIVFGFGRRVCPGQQFADSSIWLAVAHVVATINIRKAIGEDGKTLTPAAEFTPGFVSHPKDFMCAITSRSAKAAKLVSEIRAMSA